ncbi:hypothetical protein BC833DRAFT_136843 [Globomyces pollinis-pini]|nr:hypothetical protein BC833DRAFT_136843 [Globomyces pollinis-pini]
MEHSTEVPATIVTIGNIENAPEQIEDNIITNDMPQDVTTTVGNIKNIKPCSPSNETPVYNTYTINSIDRTADNHMNNTEILSEETIFRPVEPKSIFTPGKQFVTKPLRGNTIIAASTGSSSNGIPASTFFFSNMLIDNSFLELATSTFLPVNDVLEATKSFSQSEPGEISVSKGDKLTIIEHLLDGWCVGINISQSSKGRFPIESVAYNAKVQLHFIYCFTADSEEILVLPDLVKYVQNNFVNSITIHHISIDKLKESDLYPVFGTLTGDERCIVHGSTEFKELMHKFLDDFGESFWKKLDIKRIN